MTAPAFVLVVGTDTGVGKTWVTAGLAHAWRGRGRRLVALKPVETGCPGEPTADEDGVRLAQATGQAAPTHALWRLRDPVAPAEAAERQGLRLDFAELVAELRRFAAGAELALVEGAGGLLSPLTWEHDLLDLARALSARVLLVAADRLGTISHTRLALRALAEARVPVVGVVLGDVGADDASRGTNAAAIARLAPATRIVTVRRGSVPAELADDLGAVVDWLDGGSGTGPRGIA